VLAALGEADQVPFAELDAGKDFKDGRLDGRPQNTSMTQSR
jgi:hypothetical protein